MTPGEGVISVLYDPGDGQELEIAQGIVRSNGDFDLSLRPAGAVPGGGRRPLDALCEDAEMVNVTVSNPDQLVVPVRLDVTELYEEGRHARPEGSVMVREGPPPAAGRPATGSARAAAGPRQRPRARPSAPTTAAAC